jgi:rubrerythrin
MAFMKRVIATPGGRAHLLRELADAEGNGENGFFESILAKVDDPGLRQVIKKHKEDELRHEQMFLACAERTGVKAEPLPENVKYVERIFDAVGFYDQELKTNEDIMSAYLLLQAIEERSVVQFRLFEKVFAKVDPLTAATFAAIRDDEVRHIKYCRAVAKKYAPDAATLERKLQEMRELEAHAFAANGRANLAYVFSRGWFAGGAFAKWFFRTLSDRSAEHPPLPRLEVAHA